MKRILSTVCAGVVAVTAVACDDDPNAPRGVLALTGCPTGTLNVNAPIALEFTEPILPATVTGANIVVSDAATGVEFPGGVGLNGAGSAVLFTPSAPLPFDTIVRVRVQNIRPLEPGAPLAVTVCEARTQLPPITELFWQQMPSAGGNRLVGASLIGDDIGFVMSTNGVVFRSAGGEFGVAFNQATFRAGFDISFATPTVGFASFEDPRRFRSVLTESVDGGVTFDTLAAANLIGLQRLYFRAAAPPVGVFGVASGGSTQASAILKYRPETRTLTTFAFTGSSNAVDIDFTPADTLRGAVVSLGVDIGQTFQTRGRVYATADGGNSWTTVTNAEASEQVLTYRGVALRNDGTIYVAGGNGYLARLTPGAGLTFTVEQVVPDAALQAFDPTNPESLLFSDVQFAPDDDRRGWLVGAQQTGVIAGVPRFQGLIYETRDGGATWTRQGVRGAPGFGAEFPRLNRLSVRSSTSVWVVGDGGFVASYQP